MKGVVKKNRDGIYVNKFVKFPRIRQVKDIKTVKETTKDGADRKLKEKQILMDKLFELFKLESLEGWLTISRTRITFNGGWRLFKRYDNLQKLLPSIYPYYPWNFIPNNIHEFDGKKFNTLEELQAYKELLNNNKLEIAKRIKNYIVKYQITQKNDWYRVPSPNHRLTHLLLLHFPSERWNFSSFLFRSKKSAQRLLFACTQRIYPSLLIFENYLHPLLIHSNIFELDLFIPALQLALEYQGQHHYDDLPSRFAGLEVFQYRDELKEKIASDLSIKIVYIPYWWDHSLSSLHSSILNYTSSTLK